MSQVVEYFIGIDPGLDGGLCLLQPSHVERTGKRGRINRPDNVLLRLPPTLPVSKKSGKRQYHVVEMVHLLRNFLPQDSLGKYKQCVVLAVLEKQQAMSKQGISSTFSTGRGYGLWEGILAALSIPYVVVTPRTWTGSLLRGIPGDNVKSKSIIVAGRLYPDVDLRRSDTARKPHHGFSDALLLAHWGFKHQDEID